MITAFEKSLSISWFCHVITGFGFFFLFHISLNIRSQKYFMYIADTVFHLWTANHVDGRARSRGGWGIDRRSLCCWALCCSNLIPTRSNLSQIFLVFGDFFPKFFEFCFWLPHTTPAKSAEFNLPTSVHFLDHSTTESSKADSHTEKNMIINWPLVILCVGSFLAFLYPH